jgi:hypothetical protein
VGFDINFYALIDAQERQNQHYRNNEFPGFKRGYRNIRQGVLTLQFGLDGLRSMRYGTQSFFRNQLSRSFTNTIGFVFDANYRCFQIFDEF